jgi:arsenate reductase
MYSSLKESIAAIREVSISDERKAVLEPLIDYIKSCRDADKAVGLNFICTHNSRRSHLAQIWAQTAAAYHNVDKVHCYSGGTEATAMYIAIRKTLEKQGFGLFALSESKNPVIAIKYDPSANPIIAFSKKYNHPANPESDYGAVMTCSHADENCPIIFGADKRIPVTYLDPKAYDDSPQQMEKYMEKSVEIGSEMLYVFGEV